MPELRVRRPEGWTTVSFPDDIERIGVSGGRTGSGQLALTLVGERDGQPNLVETGILDVAPEDESKIINEVPRTADGMSVPVAQLRPD